MNFSLQRSFQNANCDERKSTQRAHRISTFRVLTVTNESQHKIYTRINTLNLHQRSKT